MTYRSTAELTTAPSFEARPTTRTCLADKVAVSESLVSAAAVNQRDVSPLAFVWDLSQRLVERLALTRGQRVLDLCCGTGATSIPAAQRVGSEGRVLGIDSGARLIARARARASRLAFAQAQFQVDDFETTTLPVGGFDAVLCAFGIARASDPVAVLRVLWSQLRPGGALAIAVFARGLFHPADDFLVRSLAQQYPQFAVVRERADELGTEGQLAALLETSGVSGFLISTEPCEQQVRTPADWWSIVRASMYRDALSGLQPDVLERLRHEQIRAIEGARIHSVRTDALFVIARKPLTR